MLERIIASKSKVKILRKMIENQDREFCLGDLAKLTNLSFGTVYPALKDISDSRIVTVRKIGRSKVYRANKKHVLFRELEELYTKERDAFVEIAGEFAARIDKRDIKNIVLFGSVARREFTGKSDIDLLFICKSPNMVKDRVGMLSQEFLDEYDIEISPTFLSAGEAEKRKKRLDRFVLKVLDEGKVLYGDIRWLGK